MNKFFWSKKKFFFIMNKYLFKAEITYVEKKYQKKKKEIKND